MLSLKSNKENFAQTNTDNNFSALKKFCEKGDACHEKHEFHHLGSFAVVG